MAKPEWGTKHTCSSCATKFYDMGKTELICPSCGEENQPLVVFKQRRPVADEKAKKPAPEKKKEEEEVEDEDDALLDDDDEDDALLPDDDDDDADDEIGSPKVDNDNEDEPMDLSDGDAEILDPVKLEEEEDLDDDGKAKRAPTTTIQMTKTTMRTTAARADVQAPNRACNHREA